jgi:hypothetical protein
VAVGTPLLCFACHVPLCPPCPTINNYHYLVTGFNPCTLEYESLTYLTPQGEFDYPLDSSILHFFFLSGVLKKTNLSIIFVLSNLMQHIKVE